ncbi:MAG: origin recognition complex subunit 2 [Amphiamblys sp. WSBS2006]|nr:MAG: origin recognition complex subunit 2 [Amphiamblys sp. WSBS2006]
MSFRSVFAEKTKNKKEIRQKTEKVEQKKQQPRYASWKRKLSRGFSVCLYGYGPKTDVLKTFIDTHLKPRFSTLLLSNISEPAASSSLLKTHFKNKTEKNRTKHVLIIPNIERADKALAKQLLKAKHDHKARFVFTTEHIHPQLLLPGFFPRFSVLWFHCPTDEEHTASLSEIIPHSAEIRKLQSILSCVSKNTKEILKTILSCSDSPGTTLLGTALEECKKSLLVSDEKTFRTHLTEFVDHSIFKLSRNKNGKEIIAYDKDLLV